MVGCCPKGYKWPESDFASGGIYRWVSAGMLGMDQQGVRREQRGPRGIKKWLGTSERAAAERYSHKSDRF